MTEQHKISGWLTPEDDARAKALIPGRVSINEIAREVSETSGIPVRAIMGRGRTGPVAAARHLVWFVAHRSGLSFSAIGREVGCDHTTVAKGVLKEAERRDRQARHAAAEPLGGVQDARKGVAGYPTASEGAAGVTGQKTGVK